MIYWFSIGDMDQAKYKKKLEYKKLGTWKKHRGNRKLQSARYKSKYKLKDKAHRAVYCAIKIGKLIQPKICSKCHRRCKPHAHHNDYNKPLKVKWLCWKCHNLRHKK